MTATARVAVFASGYGANLETCLRLASRRPDLVSIATVVSDKPGCRATQIAHGAGIPCIARSFDQLVGRASDCTDDAAREAYRHRARAFHEYICRELVAAHGGDQDPARGRSAYPAAREFSRTSRLRAFRAQSCCSGLYHSDI
jgi:hypothetical protein